MKYANQLLLSLFSIFILSCNENIDKKNTPTIIYENANWKGCMLSAYLFQEDGRYYPENALDIVKEFENLTDKSIGSVMWYPTFADTFPSSACSELVENNYIPHLTWELFHPDSVDYNTMPIDGVYQMMDQVLSGNYDTYIEEFALQAKALDHKLYIRFLHEFNGNWYLWSGNKNGAENAGPEKVVSVWKYVVDKFNAIGADKVEWVWNPHGPSVDINTAEWNSIEKYWPGDEYVDWIGMDAYNWYPKDPWGGERPYRDFNNCFRELYDQCVALSNKPIMIAEFGTPEFSYNETTKVEWIENAFYEIKHNYPSIKLLLWFHIDKELNWKVNSSEESLKAYKDAISDPYFIGQIKE